MRNEARSRARYRVRRPLLKRIKELEAMLRRLEWARPGNYVDANFCIVCEQEAGFGHESDCELGMLLKEA